MPDGTPGGAPAPEASGAAGGDHGGNVPTPANLDAGQDTGAATPPPTEGGQPEGGGGGGEPTKRQIKRLEDAAEAAGVSVEEFLGLETSVKADGREYKVPLKEALENYQRRSALGKRFEQAAAWEKEKQAFLDRLKDDPMGGAWSLAEELGATDKFEAALYERMEELVRRSEMSPEEQRKAELDQREQALRAEEERIQKKLAAEKATQEERRYLEKYQRDFTHALKEGGYPVNEDNLGEYLAEMADIAIELREAGWEASPEEIVGEMRHRESSRMERARGRLSGLEGEDLLNAVGPEVVERIRKAIVAKVQGSGTAPAKQAPRSGTSPRAPKRDGKRDWQSYWDQKAAERERMR